MGVSKATNRHLGDCFVGINSSMMACRSNSRADDALQKPVTLTSQKSVCRRQILGQPLAMDSDWMEGACTKMQGRGYSNQSPPKLFSTPKMDKKE
jgi:hypothetical protein